MHWITVYGELFVLLCVIQLEWSAGVQVTNLNVPELVDPQESLILGCSYDLGGEELHSVKWYKDEQEFFRYTPRQQPHVLAFPVVGVHLEQHESVACDTRQCSVGLIGLSTAHSSGVYKCEVSMEAPKFRVGFREKNVTVAAVGRAEPLVQGLHEVYAVGNLLHANCTAAAADPAPAVTWLLNGAPAPAAASGPQRVSLPDRNGLVVASRDLHFHVDRRHFSSPDNLLRVVCVAAPPPGVPAPPRASSPGIARLLDLQASTHQQQRDFNLVSPNNSRGSSKLNLWLSALTICVLVL